MGIYLLFLIIIFITYVAYRLSDKMVASPIFVFSCTFAVATFICICNSNWVFDISKKTIMVIVFGIISFGLGHILCKKIVIKGLLYTDEKFEYTENKRNTILVVVVQLVCFLLFSRFIINIGGGFGLNTVKNARTWMLYNDIPNLYGQVILCAKCIALVSMYILIKKRLYDKNKENSWMHILVVLIYVFIEILSSSRSGLIYYSGYTLVLFAFFYQKNTGGSQKSQRKKQKKAMRIFALFGIIVLSLFVLIGNFTGKTKRLGATNMISVYFGGSIYNLEYFINNDTDFKAPTLGYNTLPLLNSVKGVVGIKILNQEKYYFPMNNIIVKNEDGLQRASNLYTCFTKPIVDFGYMGMIIFFFILGIIYALVYYSIFREKKAGIKVIYYGYIMMPIFGASSEYVFGSLIFSPAAIYQMIYIYFFYHICMKKK